MSDEEEDANVQQLDCCGGTCIAGFFRWILQYNPFSTALRGQEGIVEGFTFDGNPGHEEDDAIMEPPSPSLPKRGESYSVEEDDSTVDTQVRAVHFNEDVTVVPLLPNQFGNWHVDDSADPLEEHATLYTHVVDDDQNTQVDEDVDVRPSNGGKSNTETTLRPVDVDAGGPSRVSLETSSGASSAADDNSQSSSASDDRVLETSSGASSAADDNSQSSSASDDSDDESANADSDDESAKADSDDDDSASAASNDTGLAASQSDESLQIVDFIEVMGVAAVYLELRSPTGERVMEFLAANPNPSSLITTKCSKNHDKYKKMVHVDNIKMFAHMLIGVTFAVLSNTNFQCSENVYGRGLQESRDGPLLPHVVGTSRNDLLLHFDDGKGVSNVNVVSKDDLQLIASQEKVAAVQEMVANRGSTLQIENQMRAESLLMLVYYAYYSSGRGDFPYNQMKSMAKSMVQNKLQLSRVCPNRNSSEQLRVFGPDAVKRALDTEREFLILELSSIDSGLSKGMYAVLLLPRDAFRVLAHDGDDPLQDNVGKCISLQSAPKPDGVEPDALKPHGDDNEVVPSAREPAGARCYPKVNLTFSSEGMHSKRKRLAPFAYPQSLYIHKIGRNSPKGFREFFGLQEFQSVEALVCVFDNRVLFIPVSKSAPGAVLLKAENGTWTSITRAQAFFRLDKGDSKKVDLVRMGENGERKTVTLSFSVDEEVDDVVENAVGKCS